MKPAQRIRQPAVAGSFYPDDPETLHRQAADCLEAGRRRISDSYGAPKALIVPHAGYVYSGPIAGTAYAAIESMRDQIDRVVLLGPSHRVAFRGLALSSADCFRTPLGDVPLDRIGAAKLAELRQVHLLDAAHAEEHSLEVQLPFLQLVLARFELLPIVAGDATPAEVAEVIEAAWGGPETLVVVSSDLSHYYDSATAASLDRATSAAIEALRPEGVGEEGACGRVPVRGLLVAARRHRLAAHTLDLRSSGDTAGPRDRVVGYGAYAFA